MWVQAEEELAEFERCLITALAAQDVNVLEEALCKHAIQGLLLCRVEVEARMRHELLSKCLAIARAVNRRHKLELIAEGALEGEEASFEDIRSLAEFALKTQVICDVNQ